MEWEIEGVYTSQEEEEEEEEEEEGEEEFGDDSDPHSLQKGEFFGCYLLVSQNPQFKGRTYIGFTVDPKRRIRQHNAGKTKGGARKTSGRGPWEMVLIVHGFPNDISALRFEWAWQHPDRSRRLGQKIAKRRYKETLLQYRFRILSEMLLVGPWWRLPLTIRWLKQEYELPFPLDKQPPVHMPIAYGQVQVCKRRLGGGNEQKTGERAVGMEKEEEDGEGEKETDFSQIAPSSCFVCHEVNSSSRKRPQLLYCYHSNCSLAAHTTCLAQHLCPAPHLLPTVGPCPSCKRELLWGELVRRNKAASSASASASARQ